MLHPDDTDEARGFIQGELRALVSQQPKANGFVLLRQAVLNWQASSRRRELLREWFQRGGALDESAKRRTDGTTSRWAKLGDVARFSERRR